MYRQKTVDPVDDLREALRSALPTNNPFVGQLWAAIGPDLSALAVVHSLAALRGGDEAISGAAARSMPSSRAGA